MHARVVLIAAAALMSANAFAAEPHKPQDGRPAQPQPAAPSLVLTGKILRRELRDQAASPAPKRPRVGRVTTCRCGDPQPSDLDSDQEQ